MSSAGAQPFAEFTLRIVLSEIEVYTAGDTDEDIVEEPVGFIGTTHDAALRIAVFFFLRLHSEAGKQEESKKPKMFHVRMFCNDLIVLRSVSAGQSGPVPVIPPPGISGCDSWNRLCRDKASDSSSSICISDK